MAAIENRTVNDPGQTTETGPRYIAQAADRIGKAENGSAIITADLNQRIVCFGQ